MTDVCRMRVELTNKKVQTNATALNPAIKTTAVVG